MTLRARVPLLRGLAAALVLAVTALLAAGPAKPAPRKPKEPLPHNFILGGDYDTAPKLKFHPRTVFPPYLIEEGARGEVIVRFHITPGGDVDEAKVVEATDPRFGGSALGTVGRMVFTPARKNGKPVPASGTVAFIFDYETDLGPEKADAPKR